jgi:hypothetical protein
MIFISVKRVTCFGYTYFRIETLAVYLAVVKNEIIAFIYLYIIAISFFM